MPVGSVAVCRWVPGSLGCLRRTWRADASDRAGDVCSRKSLAFDEGRRGRGWRVRATVASPHRITAAISSCSSVPPRFSVLFFILLTD
ncbi:pro-neuregulin-2, membrane-bound isoform-like [Lates japonicus]